MRVVFAALLAIVVSQPALCGADPTCPIEPIANFGGRASDIEVVGNTAYIANMHSGLLIADVSDPAAPIVLSETMPNLGDNAHAEALEFDQSGRLWLMVDSPETLVGYDISNPASPQLIATIPYFNSHNAMDFAFSGDTALLAEDPYSATADLLTIDLSDPVNPIEIRHSAFYPQFDTERVEIIGDHAWIIGRNPTLQLIDISDPANPVLGPSFGTVQGIDIDFNATHAFVAEDEGDVLIFDISTPGAPTQIATIPTNALSASLDGASLFVTTEDSTIESYDISAPAAPTHLATFTFPDPDALHLFQSRSVVSNAHLFCIDAFRGHCYAFDTATPSALSLTSLFPRQSNELGAAIAGSGSWILARDYADLIAIDTSDPSAYTELSRVQSADSVLKKGNIARTGSTVLATDRVKDAIVIFDYTDPTAPTIISTIPNPTRDYEAVAVSGDTAVGGTATALDIFDISNPASPTLLASVPRSGFIGDVTMNDTVLVSSGSYRGVDTLLFDISNPATPVAASQISAGADLEFTEAVLRDNLLYLASFDWSNGQSTLSTYSVADPYNPNLLSSFNANIWEFDFYDTFIVGLGTQSEVSLVDIADPTSPAIVQSWSLNKPWLGKSIAVAGTVAYANLILDHALTTLELNGCCLGDANLDNTVDVNDISYTLFRLGDTCQFTGCPGDANLDAVVDVNDISFILFRLGSSCD